MGQQSGKAQHDKAARRKSALKEAIDEGDDFSFRRTIQAPGGGRVRDRYTSIKNLGVGAFGVVDLARDKKTGALVALKSFRADKLKQITSVENDLDKVHEMLWNEVSLQSQCRHPNVIQVIEWFQNSVRIEAFSIEYSSGGSLTDALADASRRNQQFSEEYIARWMFHVISALCYIHNLRIIHLDVKCDNFLIDSPKTNCLKLSDFGLAIYLHTGTASKRKVGTPFFMAPEIVAGEEFNSKVDCWSAGIVFMYLLDAAIGLYHHFHANLKNEDGPPRVSSIRWQNGGPSIEALRLLEGLLTFSPTMRTSARRAKTHPWIQKHEATFDDPNPRSISKTSSEGKPKRKFEKSNCGVGQSGLEAEEKMEMINVLRENPGVNDVDTKPSRSPSPPSERNNAMEKEEKDKEKDMKKVKYMVDLFDETGTGRLALCEIQNLFAAANPHYNHAKRKFPTANIFNNISKSPELGITIPEVYRLISDTPGYLVRLVKKIEKWEKLSEAEREDRCRKAQAKQKGRKSKVRCEEAQFGGGACEKVYVR